MKPEKIIRENFLRNFVLILLFIFAAGTALSSVFFYMSIQEPLHAHYSSILSILSQIKESLIITTIKINIVFFILISAGVGLLVLLYTHRIAGPLYRIRQNAKSISEGRLYIKTNLRSKDAVSSFADSLNEMTEAYGQKVALIDTELKALKDTLSELQAVSEKGTNAEGIPKKILEHDNRIKDVLGTIKF